MRRALAALILTWLLAPSDARAGEPPLLIGIAARISPRESFAYYDALLALVGKKLGRKVEMVQYSTYDEMDTALARRDLDFAFICAGPYVRDHDAFGVELLAAPLAHGRAYYYAYVIVPAGSPARGWPTCAASGSRSRTRSPTPAGWRRPTSSRGRRGSCPRRSSPAWSTRGHTTGRSPR